jgi:hypothetical protein
LDLAYQKLQEPDIDTELYDIYRAACVKEFEIILEQCGKLLKKALRPYFSNNKQADRLTFKDIFRHAHLHSLLELEACERWMLYRDNRNFTAHDYGEDFAEKTLSLLGNFIFDAKQLVETVNKAQP